MTISNIYFYCKVDIFQNMNMLEEQRKKTSKKHLHKTLVRLLGDIPIKKSTAKKLHNDLIITMHKIIEISVAVCLHEQ